MPKSGTTIAQGLKISIRLKLKDGNETKSENEKNQCRVAQFRNVPVHEKVLQGSKIRNCTESHDINSLKIKPEQSLQILG
jgi:hypothetical protein